MKKIINHILRKYAGRDWLLQRKAKTLIIMNVLLIIVIVIDLIVSSLLLNKLAPEFYSNVTILIVLLLILFLLMNGKYDIAAGLSIVVIIGGITWTRYSSTGHFSSDSSYDYIQYALDLVLILFYANLIAHRKYFIVIVFITILLLFGVYAFLLPRLYNVTVLAYTKSVVLSGFIFLVLAGLIGILNFGQNKMAIEIAKNSESRIKSISNNLKSGMIYQVIMEHNGTRRFTYLSDSVKRFYGITPEEAIADSSLIYSMVHEDDIDCLQKIENEAADKLITFKAEIRIKNPDGSYRWSSLVSNPVQLEDGTTCWDGIEFIITERKLAEKKLVESEERYHNLFKNAHDAIFIIKGEKFIECNPKTLEMFGCTRDQIIDRSPYYFSPQRQSDGTDSKQKALQLINSAMEGDPQQFEWQHIKLDNSPFDAEVSLNRLELTGEVLLFAIVRDISERKRLEKEVFISTFRGEENERTRIAKDLHDGLGPILSACKIYHYNFKHYPFKNDDLASYIKLGELLNESMESIKEISNNLSPHILRNFGLIQAVKSFVEKLKTDVRFEIECHCDFSKRYNELVEVTLYRVIIELTNNTLKYAEASIISIFIEEVNNVLLIRYIDNGKGFDFLETIKNPKGFGLINMQSRIHSIGGELDFNVRKNEGVDVKIALNL